MALAHDIPEWWERLDVSEIIEYRFPSGELLHTTCRLSPLKAYRVWPEDKNLRRIVQIGEKYP